MFGGEIRQSARDSKGAELAQVEGAAYNGPSSALSEK
jgi:hypothetical protein